MINSISDPFTPPEVHEGFFCLKVLYLGSKSESEYPVLVGDNGLLYRVHVKSSKLRIDPYLSPFFDKHVLINGKLDRLRGHRRIVIDSSIQDAIQIKDQPEIQSQSEIAFQDGVIRPQDGQDE